MLNSDIRAKARDIRSTTDGMIFLFMPPILISFLSTLVTSYLKLAYGWAGIPIFNKTVEEFGSVRSFQIHLSPPSIFLNLAIECLIITACFQLIRVVRKEGCRLTFMDCFNRLDEKNIFPLVLTVGIRRALLFVCSLPILIGTSLITWALLDEGALGAIYFGLLPDIGALFHSSSMQLGLALLIIGGLVTSFIGYSFSLVEFLLYDHLEIGTYSSPLVLFRQSWQLMKGNRWRLFLLDLSFLGWFIGIFMTLGLLAFHVYPYYWTCRVLFYEDLKAKNPLVFKSLFSESNRFMSSSVV
ncbi:TPA: DUF975 family protein [Streptococcus suis]